MEEEYDILRITFPKGLILILVNMRALEPLEGNYQLFAYITVSHVIDTDLSMENYTY